MASHSVLELVACEHQHDREAVGEHSFFSTAWTPRQQAHMGVQYRNQRAVGHRRRDALTKRAQWALVLLPLGEGAVSRDAKLSVIALLCAVNS